MTDPKRWLDEGGGGTAEERELLEAGCDARMPSALRKRVWVGIAAGVAGVGVPAGTAAGGAVGSGATAAKGTIATLFSGAAAKTVLVVVVLGGAGLGVTTWRSAARPVAKVDDARAAPVAQSRPAVGPVTPAPIEPATPPPALDPRVEVETSGAAVEHRARGQARAPRQAPATSAQPDDVAPPRAEPAPETHAMSRLREESAAVVAIRKTLLAGDAAEALRMLDRAKSDFPNGALVQEREALTVRALVESGQKDAARKRGEAFLRVFPRSPHAAEVRALLGP
jgi:hypothetical protein